MSTKNNFQVKNGISVNGQQVIDGSGNATLNSISTPSLNVGGINVASALATASNTQPAFDQANSAYNLANSLQGIACTAYSLATTAGNNANQANTTALAAFSTANTAFLYANLALGTACTISSIALTANTYAHSAFDKANSATTLAQSAFNKANTGGGGGVTQIIAGTNVTISPSNGTGAVTINATGGGGGGGGGVTPYSNAQFSQVTINNSPTNAWRNLGSPDAVQYVPSTFFQGITSIPEDNSNQGTNSTTNNIFVTSFSNASGSSPNPNDPWSQIWLVFSHGDDSGFVSSSIGQALLGMTVGQTINVHFRFVGNPWSSDIFSVPLTITVAPQDLNTAISANSSPYSYFNNQLADDPNVFGGNYSYNPINNLSTNAASGKKIIIGFTNPLGTDVSKGFSTGNYPYNWNFTTNDNEGNQRLYYPYTFFVRQGNWWINNEYSGITSLTAGSLGGTIATFNTPALYNDLIRYNGLIGTNNGVNNIGKVIPFGSNGNQVIVNANDITSTFTTSTTLQSYVGTDFVPNLNIGNSLEVIENPLTGNTMLTGNLYKTLGYQNLGTISNTFSSSATLLPRSTWIPVQLAYNGQVANFNSVPSLLYPTPNFTVTNTTYNMVLGPNNYSSYNMYGYEFQLVNLDADAQSYITTGTPVQFKYTMQATGDQYVVNFVVDSIGNINIGNNAWGFFNSPAGWVNANLSMVSVLKNGSPMAINNFFPNGPDWNYTMSSFSVAYPGIALGVNVATTGTVSNTSIVNIDNSTFNVLSVDPVNNSIVLGTTANSSINLIGSAVTTNTYSSQYVTTNDITNTLVSCGFKNLPSLRANQPSVPSSYILGVDGQNPWNFAFVNPTWDTILQNGPYAYRTIYVNANQIAKDGDPARTTQNSWQNGSLQVQGGIGVQKGIWAEHLWANTSIETPLVSASNISVSGNTNTNAVITQKVSIPKLSLKAADPQWNNVAVLLTASSSTIINDATGQAVYPSITSYGAVSQSTTIPPGATGYSVFVPYYTYLGVLNPNNFSIGSNDFTFETWLYNGTNWPYWGYSFLSAGYNDFQLMAQWSQNAYIYNNTTVMNYSDNNIYNAFWAYNGLNGSGWNHWAFTRQGNTWYFFLNGVLLNTTTNSSSQDTSNDAFFIGYPNGFTAAGPGINLYNYRVTVGTCRYTTNFTPALTPYGTAVNTVYSNTAIDAVDVYGGVKLSNMLSAPTTTNANGGYLYVDSGALKYKGSNGTVTTIGSA